MKPRSRTALCPSAALLMLLLLCLGRQSQQAPFPDHSVLPSGEAVKPASTLPSSILVGSVSWFFGRSTSFPCENARSDKACQPSIPAQSFALSQPRYSKLSRRTVGQLLMETMLALGGCEGGRGRCDGHRKRLLQQDGACESGWRVIDS